MRLRYIGETGLKSFLPAFQLYGFRKQIIFVPYDILACHSAFSRVATWPKLTALPTFIWCLQAKLCSSPHLHGNQGYSAFSLFHLSLSLSVPWSPRLFLLCFCLLYLIVSILRTLIFVSEGNISRGRRSVKGEQLN